MPSTDLISLFLAQTGGTAPVSSDQALGTGAPATGTTATTGAPAGAPGTGTAPAAPGFNPMTMLVIGLVFFAVLVLPQMLSGKKEKKKREALLASIGKGDKVLTVGGQIGYVDRIMDNEVVLKIDENSSAKARFTKAAIQQVLESASKSGSEPETESNGTIEVKTKGEKVLAAR